MFIIDFSQLAIASISQFMGELGSGKTAKEVEDISRHAIISSLISNKKKYSQKFGKMLIACDSRHYWRTDFFPQYKAIRKKNRETSAVDWEIVFGAINKIRDEISSVFPWKVINVVGAEADDINGVMVEYLQTHEVSGSGIFDEPQPILMISSDTDNLQLFMYENYSQYCPLQKKMLARKSAVDLKKHITEHIVKGDTGDGIPNIFADDDYFVTREEGDRQKSVTQGMLDLFYQHGEDSIDLLTDKQIKGFDREFIRKNYRRNSKLVMYNEIPDEVKNDIINQYVNETPSGDLELVRKYFIHNRCKLLLNELNNIG